MEKRSYSWFEKQRKTRALELAERQIVKALDTVTQLQKAVQSLTVGAKEEADQNIERLFKTEEEVDNLRREIFKEMSKHIALYADYREDILHLVKRLDTFADFVKDAARCLRVLQDTQVPREIIQSILQMTSTLAECTSALRASIENVLSARDEALKYASKVEEIEDEIDKEYLAIKKMLITYGGQVNVGASIIVDDLIEFIEQAADMCADTADYIVILSSG
ncbi:MAG: DUF47 family protein [Nitrososphaerota archaeon]|nr:DUF47 family protein [Candidatus Bathyarchaeota archaeon]MDW8049411.1 DUF47 family protein [Nitrososphaerota archaeon]